jgi:hypothetical protein
MTISKKWPFLGIFGKMLRIAQRIAFNTPLESSKGKLKIELK